MAENHRHTHGHTHHHSHGGSKGKIMLIAVAALLLTGAILIEKNSNLTALQLLPDVPGHRRCPLHRFSPRG